MIDTHTHLYDPEAFPGEEGDHAIQRAVDAGVTELIFPNVDAKSVAPMRALAARWPGVVRTAYGIHPTEVKETWQSDWQLIKESMKSDSACVALGEIGMDLYWDDTNAALQRDALREQLAFAVEQGLPAIIHCRQALEPTLEIMASMPTLPPLVFHSFTGSADDVRAIREVTDPYFGINGVVTFKNAAELRGAIPEIGADRLVLETDAPYLAPVPHRGKRNESAYVAHVRDTIAPLLSLTPQEVDAITTANAKILFKQLNEIN